MASPNEALLDEAIAAVKNGLSQRAAAKQYGVTQSTLSRRMRGTTSKRESKITSQRLSPAQEKFLCDWILNEESAGRAPNRRQVVGFATSIVKGGGDNDKLGARWLDRFLMRNPTIRTKMAKALRGSTKEASRQGVSSRNLRSGFRKTGIWPVNRSLVLDDPEAVLDDGALPSVPNEPPRPRTPPRSDHSDRNVVFRTPRKSKDILDAIQNKWSVLDRDMRAVIHKTAETIERNTAENIALRHRNQYLETQLASQKPRTKRKVKETGNNGFARVEETMKAQQASRNPPKRQRVAQPTDIPELHRTLAQTLQVIEEHENQ